MAFSAAVLRDALAALVPRAATGMAVGLSGGLDSLALLAGLAQVASESSSGWSLRAIHIDHGLQTEAAAFRDACHDACDRWGVQLVVRRVSVEGSAGGSLEARARNARYAAFVAELRPGECLLTAHHAQDQAETLLIQLLRGAGPKGLSSMPGLRVLGDGWHLRPLLGVAHRDLRAFAAAQGIVGVRDPMNHDLRFDRAYLRERVLPSIAARWPGFEPALVRSARHIADAQAFLERAASAEVSRLRDGCALSVTGLRRSTALDRPHVLRQWLIEQGVEPPSTARLTEALRQILDADAAHQPTIFWGNHALRRYRDRVFLTCVAPPSQPATRAWPRHDGAGLDLGQHLGRLGWSSRLGGLDPARLPAALAVRRRRGGETLKPATTACTQTLQHLCQTRGVLPWMRDALPLIYAGDALIAVGGLWHDSRWCVAPDAHGVVVDWLDAPMFA